MFKNTEEQILNKLKFNLGNKYYNMIYNLQHMYSLVHTL